MVRQSPKLRSSRKDTYTVAWKVAFIAVLTLFCLWQIVPSVRYYMKSPQERASMDPGLFEDLRSKSLNLGLDLQGGIHLVMQVDTADMSTEAATDAVDRAITVISNRVDQFGLAEPVVQKMGTDRIIIDLPGMQDVERAKKLIGQTARLEFKLLKSDKDIQFVLDKLDFYLSGAPAPAVPDSMIAATDSTKAKPATPAVATAAKDTAMVVAAADTGLFDEGDPAATSKKFSSLIQTQAFGEGEPSFDMLVRPDNVPRLQTYLADPGVQKVLEDARVMVLWGPEKTTRADDFRELFIVNAANEMTGEKVSDARVVMGSGLDAGRPEITVENTQDGVRDWARISGANINKRLAIVLDSTVYSSPRFINKIYGGSSRITGAFSQEEARDLAIVLRAGALPATVRIIEDRTVGPSLGADSIRDSKKALYAGAALVVGFMILYYFTAGVVSVIALALNMLIIVAYLAFFRATLTLPGIAGIILTIGMAVDANVLIFERIREELRLGNTFRTAMENGFLRARWSILDSQITTFLTGIILYNFGTGPIRGFALTLMVGIVASVFTALFVSRVIFDIITRYFSLSPVSVGIMTMFTGAKFGFISFRKVAYAISGSLIAIGLVSLVMHGGPKYSIDFLGGSLLELHFEQPVTTAEIRDALSTVQVPGTDLATSEIKFLGEDSRDVQIRIVKVGDMEATSGMVKQAFEQKLGDRIPADKLTWVLREEQVGPSIGAELKGQAIWAVLFSLLVLTVYITIRFEFKYSVGAILSLVHDVTITIGLFSLLGKEISMTIIAALLTLVGYSLNDTVVVFDRIREKLKKANTGSSYLDVLNASVDETLSRTVITSFTTILSIMALYLFGGAVIHDFAFAMLVGVVIGTYSSIFVATPLLVEWYYRFEEKRIKPKK